MSSIPHHRESILPVERAPRFVVILGLHVLALAVEVVTPALGQATMNVLSYRQPWAGVDAVFTVTVMGMTTVLPFAVTTIFLIHIEARSAVVACGDVADAGWKRQVVTSVSNSGVEEDAVACGTVSQSGMLTRHAERTSTEL